MRRLGAWAAVTYLEHLYAQTGRPGDGDVRVAGVEHALVSVTAHHRHLTAAAQPQHGHDCRRRVPTARPAARPAVGDGARETPSAAEPRARRCRPPLTPAQTGAARAAGSRRAALARNSVTSPGP